MKTEFTVCSIKEQDLVISRLHEELTSAGVPMDTQYEVRLAMVEIINNSFVHGCGKEKIEVVVSWSLDGKQIRFEVKDNTVGFNHREVQDKEREDLLSESGMGLMLIQEVLDEANYNDEGNVFSGLKSW